MMGRLACTGTLLLCCCLGQAYAATMDEVMAEAQRRLAQTKQDERIDEDRLIALAFHLAGGCPASIDGEADSKVRNERKQTIAALIGVVAERGSKRGLTKLLQLVSCGIESPAWGRERILEQAMARMIAFVPCPPPLPGEIAAAREELADFPLLRLRKGVLRAELPTQQELDDLAYFFVAVAHGGEEVGVRDEGAAWQRPGPTSTERERLFQALVAAKSAGKVLDVERYARSYLETLYFPDALHGAEEDVFFRHTPRYSQVMRDLTVSWEALGRFHQAAELWRRNSHGEAAFEHGHVWQEQVKAVIRDEEIEGRCEAAVAERVLDVGGTRWTRDDVYGAKRLTDAGFDVARLLRGALMTVNRDAGERAVTSAIDTLPATPRLFATMRLRDKGPEDWERRLQATRGVADTMQEAAVPLLLKVAEEAMPEGRQRAIAALGDLVERPRYELCRGHAGWTHEEPDRWLRPIMPIESSCAKTIGMGKREHLAKAIAAYAKDGHADTRWAVAIALGKLGVPVARPTLRRMLKDPEEDGQACAAREDQDGEAYRPRSSVREAARQALDNISEVEHTWR